VAAARGGEAALTARQASGPPGQLSDRQKHQVRTGLCGQDPRPYGFDFGRWTRRIVAELLRQRMGITLGRTAVGRRRAALALTPQKPLRRADERDPGAPGRPARSGSGRTTRA
jgi:transposase